MLTQDASAKGLVLTRGRVRAMFRARRGASAELARQLDISASAVARWLGGEVVSARIERAALKMARRWVRAAAKRKAAAA